MLHQVQKWRAKCTDSCRKRSLVQSHVQLYYCRLSADSSYRNVSNQIHGFTIDYGKFILIRNIGLRNHRMKLKKRDDCVTIWGLRIA